MTRDKCPAHYSFSDLQPWDVIDAWGVDYYLGNVLKYICRAGRKSPDRLVDLNKALHYLQKEVELAERELAESCAFTSPRKTTEDTTEDTTEETPPSWEGRVWPDLTCTFCGRPMVVWAWDEDREILEYRCEECGAEASVRLEEVEA
jgi:DNA-directed RNA polymerase subunit RPC12/RpoP